LLAATTLLATLTTALSGLRVLLTGLLLSAALSALAALLAALVLLLIHEITPWLVVVATDNARARRYVPHTGLPRSSRFHSVVPASGTMRTNKTKRDASIIPAATGCSQLTYLRGAPGGKAPRNPDFAMLIIWNSPPTLSEV
jgi:hypothetical protein